MSLFRFIKERLPRIKKLAGYCRAYVDHCNYFSYDFGKNGEEWLMSKLAMNKVAMPTIFDVGCHTGSWTKACSAFFPDSRYYLFDISADSIWRCKNSLPNSLDCIIEHCAILDEKGLVDYVDFGNDGNDAQLNTTLLESSWTPIGNSGKMCKVNSISGDEYCENSKISSIAFLKLDCEGADHKALAGFANLLSKKQIRIVQFEYGYTNGDSGFLMKNFYHFFSSFGYKLAPLRPTGLIFSPWKYEFNDFNSGPYWIAILEDDIEMARLLSTP